MAINRFEKKPTKIHLKVVFVKLSVDPNVIDL